MVVDKLKHLSAFSSVSSLTKPRYAVRVNAGGFGKTSKKPVTSDGPNTSYVERTNKRRIDLREELAESEVQAKSQITPPNMSQGKWAEVFDMKDFPTDKPTKAIQLGGGKILVLYKYEGKVYCSDAYSTAYQYPLVDAKVFKGANGPVIETPLDGTTYELETGKVINWCPQDSVVRKVLGTLKASVEKVDLTVYKTVVNSEGKVFIQLTTS